VRLGLAVVAILVATSAFAEEPAPNLAPATIPAPATAPAPAKYYLELDQADLNAVSEALLGLPKRVADPLILKLNGQLQAQEQLKAAADKSIDDAVAKAKKHR
jgi:hypothetical protein